MNFNESATYSNAVGLQYLKIKFPNAKKIIDTTPIDKFAPYDFVVIDQDNSINVIEVKVRSAYYDSMLIEQKKFNALNKNLKYLPNSGTNKNKNLIEGKAYYLNVLVDKALLFDINNTSKTSDYKYCNKHTASDGYNGKVLKPVYLLKSSDAEVINLTQCEPI